jgi:hypothetical protein
VGEAEGDELGLPVGEAEGDEVGLPVGEAVGEAVGVDGDGVHSERPQVFEAWERTAAARVPSPSMHA